MAAIFRTRKQPSRLHPQKKATMLTRRILPTSLALAVVGVVLNCCRVWQLQDSSPSNTHNHHPFLATRHKIPQPSNNKTIRLLIMSVTGTSGLKRAMRIQDSWQQFLGTNDQTRIVCDVGCIAANGITNATTVAERIVELDKDLVASIQRPRHFEADPRNQWGYRLSQLKFYYGLLHQVQHFVTHQDWQQLPQWFLVKDDDTYIHADRLMQLVEGVNYDTEKVSVVGGWAGRRVERPYRFDKSTDLNQGPPEGCLWPNGGTGWLISRAMAVELAISRRQELLDFFIEKLERAQWSFHYDIWLPVIASWGGGRLYHSQALVHLFPGQDCVDTPMQTSSFASIHMKDFVQAKSSSLEEALASLEVCMSLPFVSPKESIQNRISTTIQGNSTVVYCPE